jgi:hypothetical protein
MDGDDTDNSSNNSGNNDAGYGNGGGNGSGSPYRGGGNGGAASYASYPAPSFSGTVNGAYGGGGKHQGLTDPTGCVYKGVMTDAQIATCKAASEAEMMHKSIK